MLDICLVLLWWSTQLLDLLYFFQVGNLCAPVEEWTVGGTALTSLMDVERRHGTHCDLWECLLTLIPILQFSISFNNPWSPFCYKILILGYITNSVAAGIEPKFWFYILYVFCGVSISASCYFWQHLIMLKFHRFYVHSFIWLLSLMFCGL